MSQRQDGAVILGFQRPRLASGRALTGNIGLGLSEIGQGLLVTPAAGARLRPAIEVCRLAADIAHAVDRRAAAQNAATRPVDRPSGRAGLRLAGVVPVDPRVLE